VTHAEFFDDFEGLFPVKFVQSLFDSLHALFRQEVLAGPIVIGQHVHLEGKALIAGYSSLGIPEEFLTESISQIEEKYNQRDLIQIGLWQNDWIQKIKKGDLIEVKSDKFIIHPGIQMRSFLLINKTNPQMTGSFYYPTGIENAVIFSDKELRLRKSLD
jgi:uncharacterized protein YycO